MAYANAQSCDSEAEPAPTAPEFGGVAIGFSMLKLFGVMLARPLPMSIVEPTTFRRPPTWRVLCVVTWAAFRAIVVDPAKPWLSSSISAWGSPPYAWVLNIRVAPLPPFGM